MSSQKQFVQGQRQAIQQLAGDKSLPSYTEAMQGRPSVDVSEKKSEIEQAKSQSKMVALKSFFKSSSSGAESEPSNKQYDYVVSKNGAKDTFPFQHHAQMRFGH